MGQYEIFDWLKKQRLSGCDDYFSPAQVQKAIGDYGDSVRRQLRKLHIYGYVEVKATIKNKNKLFSGWNKTYRAREQVLKREYEGFVVCSMINIRYFS